MGLVFQVEFHMSLILGIDAAWTARGSSGVALLDSSRGRVIACAPSYDGFVGYSKGIPVNWDRPPASALDALDLLDAATRVGHRPVDVVAIDMPIASTKISSRRVADQEISLKFGSAWAGTHSPNIDRPGAYGHSVTKQFIEAGYSMTVTENASPRRSLIEVYPLAALVRLLNVQRRPLYKVSKCRREWPRREERIANILKAWHSILECLDLEIARSNFPVPEPGEINTLSALKPYEDALDAIISAYVGALFLHGSAEPHGDAQAAIWVPKISVVHSAAYNGYLAGVQETLTEWDSPSDSKAFRTL
jgi:predicted RNase H-like nuclease